MAAACFWTRSNICPCPCSHICCRSSPRARSDESIEQDSRQIDVRMFASSSEDLKSRVREGSFHEGFYAYLASRTVEIAPLKERREDIATLARHFAQEQVGEQGSENLPLLSVGVIGRLQQYDYPGNARELKEIVERAISKSAGRALTTEDLQLPAASARPTIVPRSGKTTQLVGAVDEMNDHALYTC
mgnify:FL=1